MNAQSPHVRIESGFTRKRPLGHDAPKHSVERANYEAACIAAGEVRLTGLHRTCERHRAAYEAWLGGERAWPWPEPTPAEQARADDAVRGLLSDGKLADLPGRWAL